MQQTITLIMFFFVCNEACTQGPDWLWSKHLGGTGNEQCKSMCIDASGNVYTTGSFQGTVDFDPNSGTSVMTAQGGSDIFISKLDAAGNLVWAKSIGGTGGYAVGMFIDLDPANESVFITGTFDGTVDFDPSIGVLNLTSGGSADIFVLKADTAGDLIWTKQMTGSSPSGDCSYSLAVDAIGNVYTTGFFHRRVDFDPGAGTFELSTGSLGQQVYCSKLNSSGDFIWAFQVGGMGDDQGHFITLDSLGYLYLSGTADNGTWFFSSSSSQSFFAKYDTSGVYLWAYPIAFNGGASDGASIAVDAAGNIYTTGYFEQTANFDFWNNAAFFTSAGAEDVFISQYDTAGAYLWAKRIGGAGNDIGSSIALDAFRNVYVAGSFSETCDFDPDTLSTYYLTSNGNRDIFVCKLDNTGDLLWAKAVGGKSTDAGLSLVVNTSGEVFVAGEFYSDSISFGATSYANADRVTDNTSDVFVAKLSCTTTASINPIACDSYKSPSGNQTFRTSGTYHDIIPNAFGCDSIITIHLTINNADISVTQSGASLFANAADATYQWLDCSKDFSPITGDTSQTFNATANGEYAVEVTQRGCVDTSSCYAVTGLVSVDVDFHSSLDLFPNPARELLIIRSSLFWNEYTTVVITDIVGRIVYSTTAAGRQRLEVNTGNFVGGAYLVHMQTGHSVATKHIVVLK